jgi:hypothetical protein
MTAAEDCRKRFALGMPHKQLSLYLSSVTANYRGFEENRLFNSHRS